MSLVSEHVFVHRHLACFILGCIASLAGVRALAAPDPNWSVQSSMNDCSGSAQQQTAGCEGYATDFYEHLDYGTTTAPSADIQTVRAGFDADYYYFEYDFVDPWSDPESTGHNAVLEVDTDASSEFGRGDFYIGLFQKTVFNSTSWIDAFLIGNYLSYSDDNNDVGGAQPLVSDFGGSEGDGYESVVSQGTDRVWARVVNGNFQVAIRRTVIGDPQIAYFRPWSRQSTSLSPELYFHDHNSAASVKQIDNLCGVPMTTCIGSGPGLAAVQLNVAKNVATIWDPFNLTTNPKSIPGAIVQYDTEMTNTGIVTSDADSLLITDPIPTYLSLRVVDFDAGTSGPVRFVDGSPSSGLTYTFTSLGSTTDDVEFSDDGGTTYTYTPVPDGAGLDANVTHIRIRPKGDFQGSGANFTVQFKVGVK